MALVGSTFMPCFRCHRADWMRVYTRKRPAGRYAICPHCKNRHYRLRRQLEKLD